MMTERRKLIGGQLFLALFAFIWIIPGVFWLIRMDGSFIPRIVYYLMGIGMIGYGLLLSISGFLLSRRKRIIYILALGLQVVSILLIIFDDVGWVDILVTFPILIGVIYFLVYRKTLGG